MKMSQKMILLFSLLAIMTTAGNSFYSYQSKMADLEESTYKNLDTLGTRILTELEQYVQLMDYALESLTADIEFMDALHAASMMDDTSDLGEQLAVQNILSRTLYQEPILERFYRVSVYARNGFYMSSRFEKTDSVGSMSDEARETINGLPYLDNVDALPFQRHLLGPHGDPWAQTRNEAVFSAVRAVPWHGSQIGYIEINAYLADLASIFMLNEIEGFLAQGIFDNGDQLFRYYGDDVVYANLNPSGLTRVKLDDGSTRLVVGLYSNALHMHIFVSQDLSVYNREAGALSRNYVTVAVGILLVTLLFVMIFSLNLTRNIRRLTKKMQHLQADRLLAHPDEAPIASVTTPHDREIHQLETVFDDLMNRLRLSVFNEIAMREGTLQAQLNALQLQINPHFIYNTLNIISAKSMECGNEEIIDICDQFAQMLRYATDLRSQTATLGEELQNARRYLMLAKARFEDHLEYTIDVPDGMDDLIVPKLSLQPIVENALTHGFAGRTDRREIAITGALKDGTLELTIRDNGNGFRPDVLRRLRESFHGIEREIILESGAADAADDADAGGSADDAGAISAAGEHLGLINTYLRLHHYSKGRIRMHLYNDCGAIVVMTLPQEERHV